MNTSIIDKYFNLSTSKIETINQLIDIYSFWNNKINLISRKDFEHFYERHVLHSLSICKVFSFVSNTKIMDLGSGGGFPGIPLAILFPNVHFFLVDSISKKTKAIQAIIKDLDLKNVKVINNRAEHVNESFDFIVSRAVAPLDKLELWTEDKISKKQINKCKNGLICLKGGDLAKEIQKNTKNIKIYSISNFFEEDFFFEKKIIHVMK